MMEVFEEVKILPGAKNVNTEEEKCAVEVKTTLNSLLRDTSVNREYLRRHGFDVNKKRRVKRDLLKKKVKYITEKELDELLSQIEKTTQGRWKKDTTEVKMTKTKKRKTKRKGLETITTKETNVERESKNVKCMVLQRNVSLKTKKRTLIKMIRK